MKINPAIFNRYRAQRSAGGFTLVEIMFALSIFMLVLAAILAVHLYGLRMFQTNQTRLTATEWSRNTLGKIMDEVRSCNALQIGSISTNGVFSQVMDGEAQQGSALLVYPVAGTNNYILYFVDVADQTFRRTTDQPDSTLILADSVTNVMAFSAQDFNGITLTNRVSDRVIHLALDFEDPGSFMLNPYQYQLETSVTRRALQ